MKEKIGKSYLDKPNKPIKNYKSENTYLNAVYRKNEARMKEAGMTLQQFKQRVENIKLEDKKSLSKAVEALGRTRVFMTRDEVALEEVKYAINKRDLRKALRDDKLLVTERYIDEKGRERTRTPIKWENFKWNSKEQRFEQGNVGIKFIDTDNSEEEPWWEIVKI